MIKLSLFKKVNILKRRIFKFSDVVQKQNTDPSKIKVGLQFSKSSLTDFGDLPRGEIPIELRESPQYKLSKLENKTTIFTEIYPGNFTTLSLYFKSGSRFENIDSSGSGYLFVHMLLKGAKNKTKSDIEAFLGDIGAGVNYEVGKEICAIHIQVLKEDVYKAAEFICNLLVNVEFNENQLEAEKELVFRNNIELSKDLYEQSIENLFYTSFRDHMIGQPKFGIRENISNLTKAHLEEHIKKTICGSSVCLIATGNVDHEKLLDASKNILSKLPAETISKPEKINLEDPLLTPSVMCQRDDEMYNLNVAVSYSVPGFAQNGFFELLFFEKILGSYDASKHGAAHLNSPTRQYNYFHRYLGDFPGINIQNTKYYGFSDFGLFTGFIHGNDVWGKQLMYVQQYMLAFYAKNLNYVEVSRARSELFHELLDQTQSKSLNNQIAQELFYAKRRITRSEYAKRFSTLSCEKHLANFAYEWFFDKELGVSIWGPGHNIISSAYYQRFFKTCTRADASIFY